MAPKMLMAFGDACLPYVDTNTMSPSAFGAQTCCTGAFPFEAGRWVTITR